jgi:long-subunit acyl-CoA synthetase (AMP-forming)
VLRKLHAALGLDQAQIFVSGAAPIAASTLRFFAGLDIPIREVYGLSETCGPSTFNGMREIRPGTVGRGIPGVEVRIASDGEVLLRGASVFQGYYRNPPATAECLDGDWFKTGDVGGLDRDGYLRITDRKKDLLITAGGKNVAPQPLEQRLTAIPEVAQAVVLGDRERYLAALLALQPAACERWVKEQGAAWKGMEELAADSRFRTYIEARIERINSRLATYETIKRFELVPRELSQEEGELTPTLKIKRRAVAEKHAGLVALLFDLNS